MLHSNYYSRIALHRTCSIITLLAFMTMSITPAYSIEESKISTGFIENLDPTK